MCFPSSHICNILRPSFFTSAVFLAKKMTPGQRLLIIAVSPKTQRNPAACTMYTVHKYKCTTISSLSRSNSLARHREWATPLVACPGSTFAAPSKKQKTNDVSPFSPATANPHKICLGAKKLHVVTFQNPKTGIRAGDFWALCAIPGQLPAVEWRRHLKSYVTTRPRKKPTRPRLLVQSNQANIL